VTRGLDIDRQLDLAGGGMVLLAALMIFGQLQSALSTTEAAGVTAELDLLLAQLFGVGRITLPFAFGVVGGWLIFRHFGTMFDIDYFRILGALLTFAAFLATLQWFDLFWDDFPNNVNYVPTKNVLADQSDVLWQDGEGGGFFGHVLYIWWHRQLGDWVFEIFLVFWWAFGLFFAFDLSFEKIANYVIARRHERQAREAVVVAESSPAPAAAGATGATAVVATSAPSKQKSRRKQKAAEKQEAAGRKATDADGRTEAPTDAEITADTDGDQPKRAVAEKQGRRAAPSDATITADTDGDQPKRASRNLFGRRQRSPETTAETSAEPAASAQPTSTAATKAEEKPSEPTRQPRRGLFGRRTSPDATPDDKSDNQPQRRVAKDSAGRTATPDDKAAATASDEQSAPKRGGIMGRRGRRQVSDEAKPDTTTAPAAAATTTAAGKPDTKTDDKPGTPRRAPSETSATGRRTAQSTPEQADAAKPAAPSAEDAGPGRRPAAAATSRSGGGRRPSTDASDDASEASKAPEAAPPGRRAPASPFGRRMADDTAATGSDSDTDGKADTAASTDTKEPAAADSSASRRSPFGAPSQPARKPAETPDSDEQSGGADVAAAAATSAGAMASRRRPPQSANTTEDQTTRPSSQTGPVRSPFGGSPDTTSGDKSAAERRPSSPFGRRPDNDATGDEQPATGTAADATNGKTSSDDNAEQPAAMRRPSSPFGRRPDKSSEDTTRAGTPPPTREMQPVSGNGDATATTTEATDGDKNAPAQPDVSARRPSSPFGRPAPAAGAPSPVGGRRPPTAGSGSEDDDLPEEDQSAAAEQRRAGRRPPPSPFANMGTPASTSSGRRPASTDDTPADDEATRAASLAAAARIAAEGRPAPTQDDASALPARPSGRFARRDEDDIPESDSGSPLFRRRQPTSEAPAVSASDASGERPASPFARPAAEEAALTTETPASEDQGPEIEDTEAPAPAARPRGLNFSPEERFRRRRPGAAERRPDDDATDTSEESKTPSVSTHEPSVAAAATMSAALASQPEAATSTESTDQAESDVSPTPDDSNEQQSLFGETATQSPEDTTADESNAASATASEIDSASDESDVETEDDAPRATLSDSDDEQDKPAQSPAASTKDDAAEDAEQDDAETSESEADDDDTADDSTTDDEPEPAPKPEQPDPIVVDNSDRWRLADYRELLEAGSSQEIDQHLLLQRARLIEDTLESFGAPGRVVEVNTGPVITQFGVEPNYIERRGGGRSRVKVSAIAALDKDLALALAAKSIRIEAPVPGKGYVGIEVPNAESDLVSLRDVMSSAQHHKLVSKSRLTIGLGKRVDGGAVSADLTKMPHLLVAGATGSGKSVAVNAIISCLLLQNSPEDLQFIMVDPKRVELAGYNGIPHLVAPVVVDLERIVGVLKWVQREMDDRYKRFASAGARNILDYNLKIDPEQDKMPYLIVIIDELADLMMLAPDETERLIARLAQMARATGIHLIISTQRPSVDVVTGLIKANFPARIAFAVASSVDSRVILDQPGAEKLLGRGDMLYQAPDAPAPLRMQGVYVSDPEINAITQYWKSTQALARKDGERPPKVKMGAPLPGEKRELPKIESRSDRINGKSKPDTDDDKSKPKSEDKAEKPAGPASQVVTAQRGDDFWKQVSEVEKADGDNDESGGESDELYNEAVELVQQRNKASISMLQRHFRIGYTRAARLIDVMEAEGIVGPAESGAKPRKVIKQQSS